MTAATPSPAATTAYTDGACIGNPGPGGWAWAVPGGAFASGSAAATTNQRMEVQAALEAIRAAQRPVIIAGGGVRYSEAEAELARLVNDRDVPMSETYRGVFPFLVSDAIRVALLVLFPPLSLWLVHLLT